MFGSNASIPGRPTILVVDASGDRGGWEADFCNRLFVSLRRRGLRLHGDTPARVASPQALTPHLEPQEAFNCLLLCCHGNAEKVSSNVGLGEYWRWLDSCLPPSSKLFAACTWESYDAEASRELLDSAESFAGMALAPESPLIPREAWLFFLKFFTELDLHSTENVTGRMVSFSHLKARELLRRRRLPGKIGVRC